MESGNNQQKISDEEYHVDVQVMLLCNIFGPFCASPLKRLKLSNRAVTIYSNTVIEQSQKVC